MKKYILFIVSIVCFNSLNAQRLLPVIEDSIYFCHYGLNASITDFVWEWEPEKDIYTKIEISNSKYEFFRLTDTTYHLRKFIDSILKEKGNILLRKDNVAFKDTIVCFDCHHSRPWEEVNRIYSFINPIKIGTWTFIDEKGIKTKSDFDQNGAKSEK